MDKLQHVSTCFPTEPMVALAEKLASIAPGKIKKNRKNTFEIPVGPSIGAKDFAWEVTAAIIDTIEPAKVGVV